MRESDRALQLGRVPNHTLSTTLGKTLAAVTQPRSPDCNNDSRWQKLFYSLHQETGTSSHTHLKMDFAYSLFIWINYKSNTSMDISDWQNPSNRQVPPSYFLPWLFFLLIILKILIYSTFRRHIFYLEQTQVKTRKQVLKNEYMMGFSMHKNYAFDIHEYILGLQFRANWSFIIFLRIYFVLCSPTHSKVARTVQ